MAVFNKYHTMKTCREIETQCRSLIRNLGTRWREVVNSCSVRLKPTERQTVTIT